MPIPLFIAPLLAKLAENGLSILGNAILAKGKEAVEGKLGVKIPDDPAKLTPELLQQLQIKQMDHEEFLIEAAIRREEQQIEAEKTASKEVTERWRMDMTSDSWLSKNVRPLTLVYWTIAITLLIILDSVLAKFEVKSAWIELIETSYTIVLAAYFVGRTVQHLGKMREKKND